MSHRDPCTPAALPQARIKPYLSLQELSQLTPWSEDAIKNLMQRDVLKRRRHWFHFGRRVMFKWAAVVELIENEGIDQAEQGSENVVKIPMLNGGFAHVPAKEPR